MRPPMVQGIPERARSRQLSHRSISSHLSKQSCMLASGFEKLDFKCHFLYKVVAESMLFH